MGMLDKRAEGIQSELDEARRLREEAQTMLASYERKQKEVQEQADRIVAPAKQEAEAAATQARADLEKSIARRVAAAEEQIASAQAAAVKEVRDQSVVDRGCGGPGRHCQADDGGGWQSLIDDGHCAGGRQAALISVRDVLN